MVGDNSTSNIESRLQKPKIPLHFHSAIRILSPVQDATFPKNVNKLEWNQQSLREVKENGYEIDTRKHRRSVIYRRNWSAPQRARRRAELRHRSLTVKCKTWATNESTVFVRQNEFLFSRKECVYKWRDFFFSKCWHIFVMLKVND